MKQELNIAMKAAKDQKQQLWIQEGKQKILLCGFNSKKIGNEYDIIFYNITDFCDEIVKNQVFHIPNR